MATFLGPFQIAIHRAANSQATVQLAADSPRAPFNVTFEDVFSALEAWPRMYIEPDGSFVWVGQDSLADGSVSPWQLDGHLYDRDQRLLYVELQGTCPRAAFEQLLAACQVTLAETLIEQRRAGTFLFGHEFLTLET